MRTIAFFPANTATSGPSPTVNAQPKWSTYRSYNAKSSKHHHCQDSHLMASSTGLSSHKPQEGSLCQWPWKWQCCCPQKEVSTQDEDPHLPTSNERAVTPPPNAEFLKRLVSIYHDKSIFNTNEGQGLTSSLRPALMTRWCTVRYGKHIVITSNKCCNSWATMASKASQLSTSLVCRSAFTWVMRWIMIRCEPQRAK